MSETLKPCPFCGEQPTRIEQTITDGTVQCLNCCGKMTKADLPTAIAQWNTRPTPGEDKPLGIEEVVERVRASLRLVITSAYLMCRDGRGAEAADMLADRAIEAYEQARASTGEQP